MLRLAHELHVVRPDARMGREGHVVFVALGDDVGDDVGEPFAGRELDLDGGLCEHRLFEHVDHVAAAVLSLGDELGHAPTVMTACGPMPAWPPAARAAL